MDNKKDKEAAASGFRVPDPSTSTSSTHVTRIEEASSSTLPPPTIRLPTAEESDPANPRQKQTVGTETKPGPSVQQGKRPADPSSATPTLSATSPGPGDSRRQSDTSVDSMDQHGYGSASSSSMGGGAGGGTYPPNHPRRPMGSPSSDVQIRLTPITGRVSRAKKGVPVHVCEICNPPKVGLSLAGICANYQDGVLTLPTDLHKSRAPEVRASIRTENPHMDMLLKHGTV